MPDNGCWCGMDHSKMDWDEELGWYEVWEDEDD